MDEIAKLNEIQSKIIDLKQKAAEAEILRAERDALLNKLKLYSQEYIYPDIPRVDEYDQVVEENVKLMQKLYDGGLTVNELEKKVKDLQQCKNQVNELKEENEALKQKVTEVVALEYQLEKLLEEKRAIKDELRSAVAVEDQSDPVAKCKREIYRLHLRMEGLEEEKVRLTKEVEERSRRVEELAGRIRELEERIAVRPGGGASLGEGLRLHIQRLEEANRGIGRELAELTGKVSAAGDHRAPRLEVIQLRRIGGRSLEEVMLSRRLQTQLASHTPWSGSGMAEEDTLSTGPPVREYSEEDMLVTGDQMTGLLSVLAYNTYYLGKVYKKMDRLRFETFRNTADVTKAINSSSLLDSKLTGYERVGTSVFKVNQE